MPYKDKQKAKEYNTNYKKKWREENPDQYRESQNNWAKNNPEKIRKYKRDYYLKNKESENKRIGKNNAKYHQRNKLSALIHYSSDPPECACCGEKNIPFLTIDHINGNGNQHRKEIKRYGNIYQWLKSMNYPPGFRVLCMNCNFAIGKFGICPHQQNKTSNL